MAKSRKIRSAPAALRKLARLRLQFDDETRRLRLDLLRLLEKRRLGSAHQVRELHEILLFHYAYPDDRVVFDQVERMLRRFDQRSDLERFRGELIDSGIAGTDIYYQFLAPTAHWLAERWGPHLTVDWEMTDVDKVDRQLGLLALYAESPGLDETPLQGRAWLDQLRGGLSDAEFLIRRRISHEKNLFLRDHLYDEMALFIRLSPGPNTPSRTRARFSGSSFVPQAGPLRRARPNLLDEALRPPLRIRNVSPGRADELIDLARGGMVTRSRDLDAFADASRNDVRIIDCGDGVEFACIGVIPEKRMLLEAVYGFLILRNGVPIGYTLASALWNSSELAYNMFDTNRGAEAAYIYGRFIAIIRTLFDVDTFTVFPYQLGYGNEEGIQSGAWWFYYKLGFRPKEAKILKLADREVARMRRRPTHRSSPETLRTLASKNVFLHLGKPRDDVIGILPLDRIGLAVTDYVVKRFGWDRERAAQVCADEVAELLGAGDWRGLPAAERLMWQRLSPLTMLLPGVESWLDEDKKALARIIRSKGGRRESDFVKLFDSHQKLRQAFKKITQHGTRYAVE
jgi:hypothetical protein